MVKLSTYWDVWSQLEIAGSFHLLQLALRVDSKMEVSECRLTGTVPFCEQYVGNIVEMAFHSSDCEGFIKWWKETYGEQELEEIVSLGLIPEDEEQQFRKFLLGES